MAPVPVTQNAMLLAAPVWLLGRRGSSDGRGGPCTPLLRSSHGSGIVSAVLKDRVTIVEEGSLALQEAGTVREGPTLTPPAAAA